MSAWVGRRSKGHSNGDNDEGGEEVEENVSEIICTCTERGKEQKKKRRIFRGYRNGFKRFFSSSSPSAAPPPHKNSRSLRKVGWGLCCCVCLVKPQVLEKNNVDADGPEELRFEGLKSMLENNEFYSEECNIHVGDHH